MVRRFISKRRMFRCSRDAVEDIETKKDAETMDAVSTSTIPLHKGKWVKMAASKPDKPMFLGNSKQETFGH